MAVEGTQRFCRAKFVAVFGGWVAERAMQEAEGAHGAKTKSVTSRDKASTPKSGFAGFHEVSAVVTRVSAVGMSLP